MKTAVYLTKRSNNNIPCRLALLASAVSCAAAMLNAASAQTLTNTYLDATSGASGNTTLWGDGSTFTPPLNGNAGLDINRKQHWP